MNGKKTTRSQVQTKYALVRTPADLVELMGLAHPYRILKMGFTIGNEYWTWCGGDHPYEATRGEKRIHKNNPVRKRLFNSAQGAVNSWHLRRRGRVEDLERMLQEAKEELAFVTKLGNDIYLTLEGVEEQTVGDRR